MFTKEYIEEVSDKIGYFFPFSDDSFSARCLLDFSITKEEWIANEVDTKQDLYDGATPEELERYWRVIEAQRIVLINAITKASELNTREIHNGTSSNATTTPPEQPDLFV